MPQMMPMNWFTLYVFTIYMLVYCIIIIYFQNINMYIYKSKKPKLNYKNWNWKW